MNIKGAFSTFKDKVVETVSDLPGTLDHIQDSATAKLNDAKKTKLGKKVTYIMGGNPDADKALEYQKQDLPEDTDNNVVEKLDEFLDNQKGE